MLQVTRHKLYSQIEKKNDLVYDCRAQIFVQRLSVKRAANCAVYTDAVPTFDA